MYAVGVLVSFEGTWVFKGMFAISGVQGIELFLLGFRFCLQFCGVCEAKFLEGGGSLEGCLGDHLCLPAFRIYVGRLGCWVCYGGNQPDLPKFSGKYWETGFERLVGEWYSGGLRVDLHFLEA